MQIGSALPKGGPAGLFLGFVVYGTMIFAVNQCFGEYGLTSSLLLYANYSPNSGDDHLSSHSIALRPTSRLLGRRCLELCYGVELLHSYGCVLPATQGVMFWLHLANPVTAFAIPYEITAINVLLTYWTDKVPVAAVVIACFMISTWDSLPSAHSIAS